MDYFFEGITPYDSETLRDFARFQYRRVNLWLPILFLVLGSASLVMAVDTMLHRPWDSFLFPLVMGVILFAFAAALLTGRMGARAQNAPGGVTPVNRYRFYPDRVEYANAQNQGFYYYHQFLKAYENRDYFFLYVAKNQALLVKKSGLTLGHPMQVREFLMQQLGPRFLMKL